MTLESRRRVKEQQRRVFKSEFINTHFSYILGPDGPEQFVSTRQNCIATKRSKATRCRPVRCGAPVFEGTGETGPGLYRIDVTCGPGGGVKILKPPTPPAFPARACGSASRTYTRAPRSWLEIAIPAQGGVLNSDASHGRRGELGAGLGIPVLVALCGGLLWTNAAHRTAHILSSAH